MNVRQKMMMAVIIIKANRTSFFLLVSTLCAQRQVDFFARYGNVRHLIKSMAKFSKRLKCQLALTRKFVHPHLLHPILNPRLRSPPPWTATHPSNNSRLDGSVLVYKESTVVNRCTSQAHYSSYQITLSAVLSSCATSRSKNEQTSKTTSNQQQQ